MKSRTVYYVLFGIGYLKPIVDFDLVSQDSLIFLRVIVDIIS